MSPTDGLRYPILGACLLAALLGAREQAWGQPLDLLGRVGQLQREAAGLRLELAQAVPGDRSRFASFETRLLRIEEELRALTGRIEELEHRSEQLERRLDALAARDVAAAGTEPRESVAAAAPAPGPSTVAPQPAQTSPGATVAGREPVPAPPEEDEAARRGYVLGTIPPEVLRGEGAAGQGTATETGPPVAAAPGGEGAAVTGPAEARLRAALEGTADERYRAALDLLEAGDFDAAELAFSRFVEDFPDDPRAPTAAFWLGETHFFRQDFATAAAVYARNYRKYGPDAPRAADTLLKLGMSLAALGDRERACRTFEELERRHPDAPAPVRQMLVRERTAAGCG